MEKLTCFRLVEVFNFYLYLSTDRYNFITERKQFYQDILVAHNRLRDIHYAKPLKLDQKVRFNI